MSRYYRVEVEIKSEKISIDKLIKIMTGRFGWEEMSTNEYQGIKSFQGEGYLHGGKEESHNQIKEALLKEDAEAKIKTRWTYLEELPNNEYGSL